MEETLLLYRCYNLSAEAARNGGLVTHNQFSRFLDTACNAFNIPRKNGTQIDELAGYTILRGQVACSLERAKLCTPANNCDVGTWTDDFCLTEWYLVVSIWNLFDGRSVEDL